MQLFIIIILCIVLFIIHPIITITSCTRFLHTQLGFFDVDEFIVLRDKGLASINDLLREWVAPARVCVCSCACMRVRPCAYVCVRVCAREYVRVHAR